MSLQLLRSLPKKASASEIRKSFIDFFCEENKHLYIPSSPVFSLKDPTLAFTNAGMNQFKDVFLGTVQPAATRVANSQKCIRIGGAHNDLDHVGQDGYHHTFFEMLGNWSFGDYFKEKACQMSWDLLTKVYQIPPERLYVTYFGGEKSLGLDPDDEVRDIWRKMGIPENHILPFGAKENFWTGGTTGPCGLCTEIHYDHCPERSNAGDLVNTGSNEVTELWNLVFIHYDRKPSGELKKLNTHFVDTGMGLERLVAVLQGKTSNYDTDLFLPLFEVIREYSGHSGYTGKYDGNNMDCYYRMLADHSRMIAVALSDGMMPNHQAKVRTIIKKALAITEKVFNSKQDLLKELTSQVAQLLMDAYPAIAKNLPKIHYVIDYETDLIKINKEIVLARWKKIKHSYPAFDEQDIIKTPQIIKGLEFISKNILSQGKNALSGKDIFELFDTHGVNANITEEIAVKLNLGFDMTDYKEYESLRKRNERKETHEKFLISRTESSFLDVIAKVERKNIPPTFDYLKNNYRVDGTGKYIFEDQPTTIEAIIYDNDLVDEISAEDISEGKELGLILDRTQLFAEEGNQCSDCGIIQIEREITFDVKKLVKVKGYVIHFGSFRDFPSNSKLSVPSTGVVKVDENRRLNVMRNNTALHLLNGVLKDELYIYGEKFSQVTPDKLTLTFLVYRKSVHLPHGIEKLEKSVKDFITHGVSVKRKIFNHLQFHSLEDVVFIPGENILESEIPVIEINSGFKLFRKFCSGVHLLNTSDLQDFVITKYRKGSFHVHQMEAKTGEESLQIRRNDLNLKQKWTCLEKEISDCSLSDPFEVDGLNEKVNEFSSELNNFSDVSYITRYLLNTAILEKKKNLKELKKSSIVNYLVKEIKRTSALKPEKFLVHCIESSWAFHPDYLESARVLDMPLLIIFKNNDSVAVHSVVPQAFVTENFSAQEWLVTSFISICGTSSCGKDRDPKLSCFLTDRHVTERQLRHIMNIATDLAKKNIKS